MGNFSTRCRGFCLGTYGVVCIVYLHPLHQKKYYNDWIRMQIILRVRKKQLVFFRTYKENENRNENRDRRIIFYYSLLQAVGGNTPLLTKA